MKLCNSNLFKKNQPIDC